MSTTTDMPSRLELERIAAAALAERYFANHHAEYGEAIITGRRVERLTWREPRTPFNAVQYVCVGGGILHVSGDLGEATYITGAESLAWWARCDLHYFAGKCEASEYGRGFRTWDADHARQRLDEQLAQMRTDEETFDDDLAIDAANAIDEGQGAWDAWMRESASELFGDDWWDFVPRFGIAIHDRCRLHLLGLQLALASLEASQ